MGPNSPMVVYVDPLGNSLPANEPAESPGRNRKREKKARPDKAQESHMSYSLNLLGLYRDNGKENGS